MPAREPGLESHRPEEEAVMADRLYPPEDDANARQMTEERTTDERQEG